MFHEAERLFFRKMYKKTGDGNLSTGRFSALPEISCYCPFWLVMELSFVLWFLSLLVGHFCFKYKRLDVSLAVLSVCPFGILVSFKSWVPSNSYDGLLDYFWRVCILESSTPSSLINPRQNRRLLLQPYICVSWRRESEEKCFPHCNSVTNVISIS